MKQLIRLSPELMARSRRFAERSVLGYERGEKDASRIYARPGIDTDEDAQFKGKAGECAFCVYLGLDPLTALDWTPRLDVGWDLVVRGRRIDVKTTDTEYLMWPVTKNDFLHECEADLFVLVRRIEADLFEISGWVSVKNFIANHHSAPPPRFLDPDTKHLHMSELREFTDATRARAGTDAERAGHPNGFVGYDSEDRFVHFCHCGKDAGHGHGVRLATGQLGTWYCAEHNP